MRRYSGLATIFGSMFHPTLWLGLALWLSPTLVFAQSFGDLDVVWAMDDLNRGDDGRALERLERVIATRKDGELRHEARFLAARAALNAGDSHKAMGYLEGLERDLPEVQDFVSFLRGHALRAQGRWSEALAAWQDLVKRDPESPLAPDTAYGIADALYALGKLSEARNAYEQAIRKNPRSDHEPGARLNLAVIAEAQKRWYDAAAGYRYIAYYRPGDPTSDVARARFEALVAAGRAAAPNVWQQLARIDLLLSSRSLEEAEVAMRELEPTIKSDWARAAFDYRQGKLAYRRRDFDAAVRLFSQLAAQSSGRDRIEYEQWLARTYSTAGRYEDSVRVYLDLASEQRKRREGREALYKAAWLSYHGGKHQDALKLFGEFIALYPRDNAADEAMWYLAWNAYRVGDLPNARATLADLRRRFSSSSLVQRSWYWEGRFAALMGELDAARAGYDKAITMEPLNYYGALAEQRRIALDRDVEPVAFLDGSHQLAGLGQLPETVEEDIARRGTDEELAPAMDELPTRAALHVSEASEMPWGAAVFDWQTPVGKRIVRLMKLGLHEPAADLVQRLGYLPGFSHEQVTYARARLLYSLGDYNAAYRIVDSAFGSDLRQREPDQLRAYFQLAYPEAHRDAVVAAAREFNISPLLVLAIMRQESAFDHRARSWASAHGLMQIIPPTGDRIAEALGVDPYNDGVLRDPAMSVRFGAWYLSQLVQKFRGNVALAISSYNAGPEAVSSWLDRDGGRRLDEFVEDIPFRETRHYVKRVLGNLAVYKAVYRQKALLLPDTVPASYLNNINF